ncbi:YfiM family lipoprotein [Rahnella contaminans]|uniref:YfiM family lipoprotein n=1 Tax=Rahnella contaminans TaxID=2703882 RepID=UPI0023DB5EA2|nr:YfiM family lipoprotein [Rahnella contaminans]MDF1896756.1 YfiM family lipoprotein [Rahnella contaminans]
MTPLLPSSFRLSVISLIFYCCGCTHFANDQWTGRDKTGHFVGSAVLAAAGTAYADNQGRNEARSRSFGLLFSVGLGATKELYDSRAGGSGWSWKDFSWDIAGAAVGYSAYHLTHY